MGYKRMAIAKNNRSDLGATRLKGHVKCMPETCRNSNLNTECFQKKKQSSNFYIISKAIYHHES